MILVDTNLLLYATAEQFPQHSRARAWFHEQLNGPQRVGLPWASLLAYLRLSANRRIFDPPAPPTATWQIVQSWLALEVTWIPEPTSHHAEILGDLLGLIGSQANLVPDAHLAALAIEHGLSLCTADRGFACFASSPLRLIYPLD